MIPVNFQLDAEDAVSLISTIDYFLPMIDIKDPDSRAVALTAFECREIMHKALGDLGSDLPPGVNPCPR